MDQPDHRQGADHLEGDVQRRDHGEGRAGRAAVPGRQQRLPERQGRHGDDGHLVHAERHPVGHERRRSPGRASPARKNFTALPIAFPDVAGTGHTGSAVRRLRLRHRGQRQVRHQAAATTFAVWLGTSTAGQQQVANALDDIAALKGIEPNWSNISLVDPSAAAGGAQQADHQRGGLLGAAARPPSARTCSWPSAWRRPPSPRAAPRPPRPRRPCRPRRRRCRTTAPSSDGRRPPGSRPRGRDPGDRDDRSEEPDVSSAGTGTTVSLARQPDAAAGRAAPKRRGRGPRRPRGLPWILPAFVFVVGLIYYCIGYTGYISTLNWDGVSPNPQHVGFANYTQLFHDPVFWDAIRHTSCFFVVTFCRADRDRLHVRGAAALQGQAAEPVQGDHLHPGRAGARHDGADLPADLLGHRPVQHGPAATSGSARWPIPGSRSRAPRCRSSWPSPSGSGPASPSSCTSPR